MVPDFTPVLYFIVNEEYHLHTVLIYCKLQQVNTYDLAILSLDYLDISIFYSLCVDNSYLLMECIVDL